MVKTIGNSDDLPKGFALVDFFAIWCHPCMKIKGAYSDLSETEEYSDVEFFKCDVDENEDFAKEHDISAMPTFILFKNGKEIARTEGANLEKVQRMMDKHI